MGFIPVTAGDGQDTAGRQRGSAAADIAGAGDSAGAATGAATGAASGAARTAELLEDWLTIWQSELGGMAYDREMQDGLLRLVEGWARQARSLLRLMAPVLELSGQPPKPGPEKMSWAGTGSAGTGSAGTGLDGAARSARPDAAPRPAAAGDASDERDAVIARLTRRIDELELRLARLDGPDGNTGSAGVSGFGTDEPGIAKLGDAKLGDARDRDARDRDAGRGGAGDTGRNLSRAGGGDP